MDGARLPGDEASGLQVKAKEAITAYEREKRGKERAGSGKGRPQ